MVAPVAVLPTILDWLGRAPPRHRLEGRSLLPILHGEPVEWRDCVFSELDYSYRLSRLLTHKTPQNARAWSVRTDQWRYVYWMDEPEQLYDLHADPDQFHDLGQDPAYATVRDECRELLLAWFAGLKRRTTVSFEGVEHGTNAHKKAGVLFGQW